MNELVGVGRRYFQQPQQQSTIDQTKRLVTFEADKNDTNDRVDEIRKKYMFRRNERIPVQNPQPPYEEPTEQDRDDSPINWINKLGKTPESSPNPLPLHQHNQSLPKGQKQVTKYAQNNPPYSTVNTAKLEKIDQINTKIKSLLQTSKEDQKELAPAPLLKANPNSYNVRTGYLPTNENIKISAASHYPAMQHREDSENRYPPGTNSPKNSARKSKNKLPTSQLYKHESACETAATRLLADRLKLNSFYSTVQKEQKERRMSYGDYNKFALPLNSRTSQQATTKASAFTSRRQSIHEQIDIAPTMSARMQQKRQHVSVMEFEINDEFDNENNNSEGSGQQEMKKLLKVFHQQIELDRKFRNAKYSYHELKDKHKLDSIVAAMNKLGVRLSQDSLVKELQITEAEYNPFHKPESCSYEELAKSYKAARDHWQSSVLASCNQQRLLASNLKQQLMFTDRNHLSVEDLVRLLNDEFDGTLRNRDLILMYRRLAPNDKLSFQDFLHAVCRD